MLCAVDACRVNLLLWDLRRPIKLAKQELRPQHPCRRPSNVLLLQSAEPSLAPQRSRHDAAVEDEIVIAFG